MNKLKYYCTKCGTELVSKRVYDHYDLETGEKKYLLEWKCPKYRFWNTHSNFITSVGGNTYPFEV